MPRVEDRTETQAIDEEDMSFNNVNKCIFLDVLCGITVNYSLIRVRMQRINKQAPTLKS